VSIDEKRDGFPQGMENSELGLDADTYLLAISTHPGLQCSGVKEAETEA
jgi:hypothetical protein